MIGDKITIRNLPGGTRIKINAGDLDEWIILAGDEILDWYEHRSIVNLTSGFFDRIRSYSLVWVIKH